jgi:hypothetical protein
MGELVGVRGESVIPARDHVLMSNQINGDGTVQAIKINPVIGRPKVLAKIQSEVPVNFRSQVLAKSR